MPSFENLHQNHKLAFLDGLLCGFLLMFFGRKILDQNR